MACKSVKCTQPGRFLLLLLALVIFGGACQQPLVQNPNFSTDFDLEAPGSSSLTGVAATSNPQPTWTWSSGGNGIGYYRYRINGGAWQDTTDTSYTPDQPLPEGIYIFEVSERDDRGNWSDAASFRTAIDLTPPDPLIISVDGTPLLDANGDPVPDTVITGETQPLWSWEPSGNGSGQFAIDSSAAGGSAPPLEGTGFPPRTYAGVPDTTYQPAAALGTGNHTVRVSERDEAGNWSDWVQFTVVIDLTIPTISLIDDSGTPGDNITNVNPPQFQVTSGTGPTVTDTYRWRVDASDWTTFSGTSPVTFAPAALSDGIHTVEVQQQREDGSFSVSASVVVTIDTADPNIPVITTLEPDPTPNFRPTWDWVSGGGGGAGVFQYDASGAGGALSGEVGVLSYTPAADLPNNATYTVSVRERDLAGNWSNWGSLDINVLNSPPVADAGPDLSVSVGLPVSLDAGASSDVETDPLTFSWSISSAPVGSSAAILNASNQVAGLTPDIEGTYTIAVEVTALGGTDTDTMQLVVTPLSVIILGSSPLGIVSDYQTLIESFGIGVTVVLQTDASSTDFSPYNAILITPDVPNTWDPADVTAIDSANRPILGIGTGGTRFFDEIGGTIGWLPSAVGTYDSVIVRDQASPIWNTPNALGVATGQTIQVLTAGSSSVVWFNGNATADTVSHAGAAANYEIVAEETTPRLLQLAFNNSPTTFNAMGADFFENLIHYLVTM